MWSVAKQHSVIPQPVLLKQTEDCALNYLKSKGRRTDQDLLQVLASVGEKVISEVILKFHNDVSRMYVVKFDFSSVDDTAEDVAKELQEHNIAPSETTLEELTRHVRRAVMDRCAEIVAIRDQQHSAIYEEVLRDGSNSCENNDRVSSLQPMKHVTWDPNSICQGPLIEPGDICPEDFSPVPDRSSLLQPVHALMACGESLVLCTDSSCLVGEPSNTTAQVQSWLALGWDRQQLGRLPLLSAGVCQSPTFTALSDSQNLVSLLQRSLAYVTGLQDESFKTLGQWCENTTKQVVSFQGYHHVTGERGLVDTRFWEKLEAEVRRKDDKERRRFEEREADKKKKQQQREQILQRQKEESDRALTLLQQICMDGMDHAAALSSNTSFFQTESPEAAESNDRPFTQGQKENQRPHESDNIQEFTTTSIQGPGVTVSSTDALQDQGNSATPAVVGNFSSFVDDGTVGITTHSVGLTDETISAAQLNDAHRSLECSTSSRFTFFAEQSESCPLPELEPEGNLTDEDMLQAMKVAGQEVISQVGMRFQCACDDHMGSYFVTFDFSPVKDDAADMAQTLKGHRLFSEEITLEEITMRIKQAVILRCAEIVANRHQQDMVGHREVCQEDCVSLGPDRSASVENTANCVMAHEGHMTLGSDTPRAAIDEPAEVHQVSTNFYGNAEPVSLQQPMDPLTMDSGPSCTAHVGKPTGMCQEDESAVPHSQFSFGQLADISIAHQQSLRLGSDSPCTAHVNEPVEVIPQPQQWLSLGWDRQQPSKLPPLSASRCQSPTFTAFNDSHNLVSLLQKSLAYVIGLQKECFKTLGQWCENTTKEVVSFQGSHHVTGERGLVDTKFWEKLEAEVRRKDDKERRRFEERKADKKKKQQQREQILQRQKEESDRALALLQQICMEGMGHATKQSSSSAASLQFTSHTGGINCSSSWGQMSKIARYQRVS